MSMLPPTTSLSPAPAARPAVDRNVLGVTLGQELGEAQKARTLYELRWLEDLEGEQAFPCLLPADHQ